MPGAGHDCEGIQWLGECEGVQHVGLLFDLHAGWFTHQSVQLSLERVVGAVGGMSHT
jgi:hypothetical protein